MTEIEERLARLEAEFAQIKQYRVWADGEIARLCGVVRKYEEALPELLARGPVNETDGADDTMFNKNNVEAEFKIDFEYDDVPTAALFVMRGDRSVLLEVKTFVNDDRCILRYENSVTYSVATPSLERFRVGFRGELANDSSERVVLNATVEDLIVALQWLVGKETTPTKETP